MKLPDNDPRQLQFDFPLDSEDAMLMLLKNEIQRELDSQIIESIAGFKSPLMHQKHDLLAEHIMNLVKKPD